MVPTLNTNRMFLGIERISQETRRQLSICSVTCTN